MKAYFQVGEEVILQSEMAPQYNGVETVISAALYNEGVIENPKTGNMMSVKNPPVYWLDNISSSRANNPEKSGWFSHSALRKKHDGAGDFESMINGLKTPLEQEQ